MKKYLILLTLLTLIVTTSAQKRPSAPPTTAFSYQGKLTNSSAPATGIYDFKFLLCDLATCSNVLAETTNDSVQVTSGIFTVSVDFGENVYNGTDRFIGILVKLHGSPDNYTELLPRQKLGIAPNAAHALTSDVAGFANVAGNAFTAQNADKLGGVTSSNYLLNNGDGSQLVNIGGAVKWNVITSNQQAVSNNGYIANSSSELEITLPANPQVGDVVRIAGAGAGGWRISTNSGQTVSQIWTPRESNRDWYSVASSADGTKLVAVVLGGQIYTSIDSGVSWTARQGNRTWTSVASSADGTKLVASSFGEQLYTSSDSGVTWTARDFNRGWFAVASSSDGTKLVAASSPGFIYTSTDSGVTWISRASSRGWQSLASSADGTKLVAVAQGEQIYTSSDSGVSWVPRESSRLWRTVASSADGTKLVAAINGGEIYTSIDSGESWTSRGNARSWTTVASSADGTRLVGGVFFGEIYISGDSGATWVPSESNRIWRSVTSSADGTKIAAVANNAKVYTTASTGQQNGFVELVYIGEGKFYIVNQK